VILAPQEFKNKTSYYYRHFEAEIEKRMASVVITKVLLLIKKKIIVLGQAQIELDKESNLITLCTRVLAAQVVMKPS
jgi:hypothetical protein